MWSLDCFSDLLECFLTVEVLSRVEKNSISFWWTVLGNSCFDVMNLIGFIGH